jgi:hypothetical protein
MDPSAKAAGGRRVTRWTRELIIEKIREWEARYGEPPCSADWNPSLARWRAQDWRAERYREGAWPSTNAAKRPFDGSFDAAVRAAGFEPRRPGPRPKPRAVAPARPDVAQREPRVDDARGVARVDDALGVARGDRAAGDGARGDRPAGDDLAAALDRAREAEARVAALERGLLLAEAKVGEVRRRARRAGDKRGRHEPVRVVRRDPDVEALERAQALIADAEARARASEDQAQAAVRDADEARAEARQARADAAAADRRARELSALVAEDQRRLTPVELASLRAGGRSGPAVLAAALKRLARARSAGDRGGLASALAEVASAAVRWRDRL